MNIKVQSVRFDADKKLLDYIESKVGKLSQYSEEIIQAEVILRIENSETNDNKVSEIKVAMPQKRDLFAKRSTKSFEESVDKCTEALRRQIKRNKEK